MCEAVLRAWALLHKQPSCIEEHAKMVLKFLCRGDRDETLLLPMIFSSGAADDDGSAQKEWEKFKICLQDAEVIPVDRMVMRMRRDGKPVPEALLALCHRSTRENPSSKKMPADWQHCKHWFVPHLLRYVPDGPIATRAVVQRFSGWGIVDYGCGSCSRDDEQQATKKDACDNEEENNNVENDQFAGILAMAKASVSEASSSLLLTKEERKVKAQAGPFHPLVVDAASKAIHAVLESL